MQENELYPKYTCYLEGSPARSCGAKCDGFLQVNFDINSRDFQNHYIKNILHFIINFTGKYIYHFGYSIIPKKPRHMIMDLPKKSYIKYPMNITNNISIITIEKRYIILDSIPSTCENIPYFAGIISNSEF